MNKTLIGFLADLQLILITIIFYEGILRFSDKTLLDIVGGIIAVLFSCFLIYIRNAFEVRK